MNSAFRTTLLMGLLAAAAAYGAIHFYPWPHEVVVDAKVNQALFEPYETSTVREITITEFDKEKNSIDQFQLRRRGEQWVMPRYSNLVATGDVRIAEAAKSLIDLTIFEKTSDNQQDHNQYGVVDPSDSGQATNRSSIGTKIVLKDRNEKELASLIVGNLEKGDATGLRRYVRIPGQPTIYTTDINRAIFATQLEAWVDPNLMQLPDPRSQSAVKVSRILVDSYRIDGTEPEKVADQKVAPQFRAEFTFDQEQPGIDVSFPNESGELEKLATPDPETQRGVSEGLRFLTGLQYRGVIRKPKALAKRMTNRPAEEMEKLTAASFAELQKLGFVFRSWNVDEGLMFDGIGGEVTVTTSDGVAVDCLIGALANKSATQSIGLSYNVMLVARPVPEMLPAPEKPTGVAEDSAENKAYLREVAERDRKMKSASLRVNDLNQQYANWIYIMPEEVVNGLRPELTKPVQQAAPVVPAADAPTLEPETEAEPAKPADGGETADSKEGDTTEGTDATEDSDSNAG